jgi:non-specific serine/threonine protein kinase
LTCEAFWNSKPPNQNVTPIALRAPELIFEQTPDSSIDIWAFGCLISEMLTGIPLFTIAFMAGDNPELADDDHILQLIDVLGSLPDYLMKRWKRASKWIGPNGERLQPPLEDDNSAFSEELNDDLGLGRESPKLVSVDDEKSAESLSEETRPKVLSWTHLQVGESIQAASNAEPGDDDFEEEDGSWISDSLEVHFDQNKPSDIDVEEAKVITDLIRKILQYEPAKRPTAEEILKHPWFSD